MIPPAPASFFTASRKSASSPCTGTTRGEVVRQLESECESKREMLVAAAEAARQQAERGGAHAVARFAAQQYTRRRAAWPRRGAPQTRRGRRRTPSPSCIRRTKTANVQRVEWC